MAKAKRGGPTSHPGHGTGHHPLAGGMKAPPTPPNPTTSSAPKSGKVEAPASDQRKGIHVPGIGGSGKSF